MIFGDAGAPLSVNPLLIRLFSVHNMFKENLIEFLLFVQSFVQKCTANVTSLRIRVSPKEVSQVSSVRVDVKISSFLYSCIS